MPPTIQRVASTTGIQPPKKRPALIVQCANTGDVQRALEFANRRQLEIAVRGGGHSFMGWGTSSGLVVDLTDMKRVAVDPVQRIAQVDAGVLGREVMRAAGPYGLAPVLGQLPPG